MKKWVWLTVALLAVVAVSPAMAQGNKFKVYAAFNYVSPLGDEEITTEENVTETIEAAEEAGWSIGFEYRFGKWAGLEVDYLQADHDIDANGVKIAETTMNPLSASFNFHLVHTKILDFYFGPTVSYVNWDDVETTEGDSISADSEFAYGAQVGLDISLIKSLAIVTGLRYTQLDITADDTTVAVNPLFAKVGLAFRW
jgi:outer membrane protein W